MHTIKIQMDAVGNGARDGLAGIEPTGTSSIRKSCKPSYGHRLHLLEPSLLP